MVSTIDEESSGRTDKLAGISPACDRRSGAKVPDRFIRFLGDPRRSAIITQEQAVASRVETGPGGAAECPSVQVLGKDLVDRQRANVVAGRPRSYVPPCRATIFADPGAAAGPRVDAGSLNRVRRNRLRVLPWRTGESPDREKRGWSERQHRIYLRPNRFARPINHNRSSRPPRAPVPIFPKPGTDFKGTRGRRVHGQKKKRELVTYRRYWAFPCALWSLRGSGQSGSNRRLVGLSHRPGGLIIGVCSRVRTGSSPMQRDNGYIRLTTSRLSFP